MKRFCPLASGSKGNCLYLGTEKTKILIDGGITAKALRTRLAEIGVALEEIDAVLITHEHTDHIKGIEALSRLGIPILANSDTAEAICSLIAGKHKFKIFTTGEPFEIADIEVHPFSIQHDAVDPVGFTCSIEGQKIGICADIGFATTLVAKQLRRCQYLYIEANHQPSMVHASNRPPIYKQRVLSRQGHLSNEECAELIGHIYHGDLKHIYLAHLSSECNAPELALKIISDKLTALQAQTCVSVAYQDAVSLAVTF